MQSFTIDFGSPLVFGTVYAKQGDTSRSIRLTLLSGGRPYVPPDGCLPIVYFRTQAGEGNYSSGITLDENILTVPIHPQMLTNAGGGAMCVLLNAPDGSQLGTWNLMVEVEGVPGMGSAEATAWFTALSETLGEMASLVQEAKDTASQVGDYANSVITVDTLTGETLNPDGTGEALTLEKRVEALEESAADALQTFDLVSLGLPTIVLGGDAVTLETDTTELLAACETGHLVAYCGIQYEGRAISKAAVTFACHVGNLATATVNLWDKIMFLSLKISTGLITAKGTTLDLEMDSLINDALGGDY